MGRLHPLLSSADVVAPSCSAQDIEKWRAREVNMFTIFYCYKIWVGLFHYRVRGP